MCNQFCFVSFCVFFPVHAYYVLIFFKDYNPSQVCVAQLPASFPLSAGRVVVVTGRSAFPTVDGE